ncbi:MAG: hypothetical protein ABSG03_00360 [Bryobacteraceae bacterium]|jgi:predicted DNA binding CopG/RHH family protein
MNDRLEVPKFASEEEEFLEAARLGRLRSVSTPLRRAREASNSLTIHLSDSDLAAIRRLAAQRGQDEDACAAAILHRALENETPDHGILRH